ncbi:hypothetical protein KIN20_012155 [Parelaphostrongylus tenuis]|uniref:Uncharacterized protein n=1 Tax=Parelaphostrongylus tenuis TaxID=148309 RepID=A0AAD5MAH4_PARTN|nr:hypothetical protein KIN20_012155 [Parelaphostrongylus tenuis]
MHGGDDILLVFLTAYSAKQKLKSALKVRKSTPRSCKSRMSPNIPQKAKRSMEKMRSATDPEYKTLELDISEWESVKILKRNEVNIEDVKKEYKASSAPAAAGDMEKREVAARA